jgi:hypothetical protein
VILRRNDGWRGWSITAALVHVLLGTCNIVFWPSFAAAGVVPVGITAATIHVIFASLELWAYVQPSSRVTTSS